MTVGELKEILNDERFDDCLDVHLSAGESGLFFSVKLVFTQEDEDMVVTHIQLGD